MLKIGIICPSEIAFRRFMPALLKYKQIEYTGVAIASKDEWSSDNYEDIKPLELQKAQKFKDEYGGEIFEGYENMITSGKIDAIYLPLPPALHHKWAIKALENNLHVFVEKPSTISYEQTKEIIELAESKSLAVHENYMFVYHSQLEKIASVIKSGEIGDIRLARVDFGFPNRGKNDFRYIKSLGGGALLDCGGYTFKYANYILGGDAEIVCANVGYKEGYEVEIFGSATLKNSKGEVVQTSFGMDNDYRCSVDFWGSSGSLKSGRILTAPTGCDTYYEISKNGVSEQFKMESDDAFYKSISKFMECVKNENTKNKEYDEILKQEILVEQFAKISGLRG